MKEKGNDEESKFFEVLQRIPKEPEEVCLSSEGSKPYLGAMAGRSVGMLRGMDGEGLKMASEQRTDYRQGSI